MIVVNIIGGNVMAVVVIMPFVGVIATIVAG